MSTRQRSHTCCSGYCTASGGNRSGGVKHGGCVCAQAMLSEQAVESCDLTAGRNKLMVAGGT
eukprot:3439346-Prorocentrum_lima.AAC.1